MNGAVAATASRGQPARLGRDGPVCGLLERSRHAYPMDPRRSWLRNPVGRRSPVTLTVPTGLASEALSLKMRLGRVHTSPVDGSWRLDFAGAPHCDQYHCSHADRLNRQVLLHLPVSLFFATCTAHRRLSGAHDDRLPSHRQCWPVAGRGRAGRPSGRPERSNAHPLDVVVLIPPWFGERAKMCGFLVSRVCVQTPA